MNTIHWGVIWMLVALVIVAVECFALGTGHAEYTLSYQVRVLRFDPIGRFVLLPLWTWLTLHWLMAPRWLGTHPDWRSAIAVVVGLVWAVLA